MRLKIPEYAPALVGRLVIANWPESNFRRFIRYCSLLQRIGTTERLAGMLADPVVVPGPPSGLTFAGTELAVIDGRTHEFSQLWFIRPRMAEDASLSPYEWGGAEGVLAS